MKAEVPHYAVHDAICIDPARTALVVIDMQNDLVKQGGGLLIPDAEATIPAITRLLDLARAKRMRVIYSQDTHRAGDPEWEIWPEHCREGSWGWEIVAELAPQCRRDRAPQGRARRVLWDAARPPAAALARRHARDLRHARQRRSAVRGGERCVAQIRRRYPARRDLGFEPFDLEATLRQVVSRSRAVTTATGVRVPAE